MAKTALQHKCSAVKTGSGRLDVWTLDVSICSGLLVLQASASRNSKMLCIYELI